jgi:hypothetical protein
MLNVSFQLTRLGDIRYNGPTHCILCFKLLQCTDGWTDFFRVDSEFPFTFKIMLMIPEKDIFVKTRQKEYTPNICSQDGSQPTLE